MKLFRNYPAQKYIILPLLILAAFSLQFCKPKQAVTKKEIPAADLVSYEKHISPIMVKSCTPCHFPEEGKKEMLNTYEATAKYSRDILERIQLPESEIKFMPFKSKKAPLTDEEISLFKTWVSQEKPR